MNTLLKKLFSLLAGLLALLLVLGLLYALWCAVAYRDLDTAALLDKYGEGLSFADIHGAQIAYRVDGELGDELPWVLVHSHYFDSLMWQELLAELKPEQAVIRYDLTSHGLSGPEPNGDYSMARDVELLGGLLDHLQVESAVLVGSSLGGNIAFHFAAQYPERSAGLVLINSGGMKRQQSSRRNAAAIPDWFYRVFYFVPTAAYRKFIEWMVADSAVVSDALVERFHDMFRHRGNRRAEMQRMASFDAGEPESVLAAVVAPSLVVWGQQNPQLPVALADDFVGLLVNAPSLRLSVVDGAGHLLPVEKPAELATLLNEFRDSL